MSIHTKLQQAAEQTVLKAVQAAIEQFSESVFEALSGASIADIAALT